MEPRKKYSPLISYRPGFLSSRLSSPGSHDNDIYKLPRSPLIGPLPRLSCALNQSEPRIWDMRDLLALWLVGWLGSGRDQYQDWWQFANIVQTVSVFVARKLIRYHQLLSDFDPVKSSDHHHIIIIIIRSSSGWLKWSAGRAVIQIVWSGSITTRRPVTAIRWSEILIINISIGICQDMSLDEGFGKKKSLTSTFSKIF